MAYHLKMMHLKFPSEFGFYPRTFCLPSDSNQIYELLKTKPKFTFIVKPEAGAQGRGIYLINKAEDIPFGQNYVVQEYISNPLLIEGYKFDLRIYVLLTSVDPLTFYIFDDGIVRMSTQKYEAPNKGNLS